MSKRKKTQKDTSKIFHYFKQRKKLLLLLIFAVASGLVLVFLFGLREETVYISAPTLKSGVLVTEAGERGTLNDNNTNLSNFIVTGSGDVALSVHSFSPNTILPLTVNGVSRITIIPYSYSITKPQGNITESYAPDSSEFLFNYSYQSECPPVLLEEFPILDKTTNSSVFSIQFAEKGQLTIANLSVPEYYFNSENKKIISYHYGIHTPKVDTFKNTRIVATEFVLPSKANVSVDTPVQYLKTTNCAPNGYEYINMLGFQAQSNEPTYNSQLLVRSLALNGEIRLTVAGATSIEFGSERFNIPDYVEIVLAFDDKDSRKQLWLDGNFGGFESIIFGKAKHDVIASTIYLSNPFGDLYGGKERIILDGLGDLEVKSTKNSPSYIHIEDDVQSNGNFSVVLNTDSTEVTFRDTQIIKKRFDRFSTELETAIFALIIAGITGLLSRYWLTIKKLISKF